MKTEILKQNQKSWNTVAEHFNGLDALPSFGPFAQNEEELQLFEPIQDQKVLDIGCGSGHSLAYMNMNVPSELKNTAAEVSDRYYSLYKALKFPTTMIIKARK